VVELQDPKKWGDVEIAVCGAHKKTKQEQEEQRGKTIGLHE
jgi:hypothetical protein